MDLIKGLFFFAKFFMIQDSIFKLSGWENDCLNYSYTKCVEYLAEQCFDFKNISECTYLNGIFHLA